MVIYLTYEFDQYSTLKQTDLTDDNNVGTN